LSWVVGIKRFFILSVAVIAISSLLMVTGVISRDDQPNIADSPVAVEPVYFGDQYMPSYVGASLRDAVVLQYEKFGGDFDSILNVDTDKILQTSYFNDSELREAEDLFVCTQNVAPGADPYISVFQYNVEISVSTACAGKVADLHMGPSAEALGVWSPAPFNGNCDSELRSCNETLEVDGIFLQFADGDSWRDYKTAIVQTGLGEIAAELAWIDTADQWCGYQSPNVPDLMNQALIARDNLFQPGQKVRLVRTVDLYDGLWFIHRLSPEGQLQDGAIPDFSLNEQLVATGFWTPEANEIKHFSGDYYESIAERKWTIYENASMQSDQLLYSYGKRLVEAANLAFVAPNDLLASCMREQQVAVPLRPAISNSNEDENDDSRNYLGNSNSRDSDGSYILNCEGDAYYEFPQLCDGGNRLRDETWKEIRAESNFGNSTVDVGVWTPRTKCVWVKRHSREGSSVKGHRRCR
jgi:hypothetical protein